ncbi:CPBP family intramembrane metalloprotease [Leptolyngbya cf. ectocarpi LEGE 11479]|uniref:CPBP family intramembrane metalloprotease n=2 Tax=Leptolyngbya ectocarpi TaxID=1202 RepID=A0A928ZSI1_LEPEC|nr:CPBP family intramembrane metalloprotease [Leptolyngbya cf. ectocarpi LEGE 11479]
MARASLLWRIILFFATLLLLWAPGAVCIYGLGQLFAQAQAASTLALVALYIGFVCHAWFWGYGVHGWKRPFEKYGLLFCGRFVRDGLAALLCGFCLVCVLFALEVGLGWASFHPRSVMPIALEGLAVGLGIAIAEELLFRGWLLAELCTGVSRTQALLWSSCIFAVAHFIKPLPEVLRTSPQFLGLLLLGLLLSTSRYISRPRRPWFSSLGLPIGLHGGLVWGYYIVDVGDLVVPSGRAPEWVTGIHGNPLSGALGVLILGCLTAVCCFNLRSK